jgi:hypothetical protein
MLEDGRKIIGIVGAGIAAVLGITTVAQRNDAGEITAAGSVGAFEVRVGDCFNDEAFEESEISEIPAVPCTEPHDNEVYAAFDLADGKWPGEEEVDELADQGCLDRFQSVIGKGYEDSVLEYTTIYPTEGSWKQVDDREVLCVAYHMDAEKLTATVRGSGR